MAKFKIGDRVTINGAPVGYSNTPIQQVVTAQTRWGSRGIDTFYKVLDFWWMESALVLFELPKKKYEIVRVVEATSVEAAINMARIETGEVTYTAREIA